MSSIQTKTYKYFHEVLPSIIIRSSEFSSKAILQTTSSKPNLHPIHLFKLSVQKIFLPHSTCFMPFLLALFSSFWRLVPQSPRVSATRRFSEPHTDIFTVAARHEGHEADTIAERSANDVLVGYGVGACRSSPRYCN